MRKLMPQPSEEMTEIVQVPAIAVNGEIKVQTPELRKLNSSQLNEWARAMGGDVFLPDTARGRAGVLGGISHAR